MTPPHLIMVRNKNASQHLFTGYIVRIAAHSSVTRKARILLMEHQSLMER